MKVLTIVFVAYGITASSAMAASTAELCRTLDVTKLTKSDVKVLAYNASELMGSDTGWKVLQISEGMVEEWPFFGSYEKARTNVVCSSHGMLDWKMVDKAMKISLKYSCETHWLP